MRVSSSLLLLTVGMVAGMAIARRRTVGSSAHENEADDIDHLAEAAAIDLFQVEAGKLARNRASDPAVQAFAARMIRHHQRNLLELRKAARAGALAVDDVPLATPVYIDLLRDLRATPGHLFDSVYLRMQLQVHEGALDLYEDMNLAPLGRLPAEAAATMAAHLAEAEDLVERPRHGGLDAAAGEGTGNDPARRGMPQTPNETPGDGGAAPVFN